MTGQLRRYLLGLKSCCLSGARLSVLSLVYTEIQRGSVFCFILAQSQTVKYNKQRVKAGSLAARIKLEKQKVFTLRLLFTPSGNRL